MASAPPLPWRSHASLDGRRRRHPSGRGLRRVPAPPDARDRQLPHPDRDDKFIVIATKGFGKTLLLKAKRILYQRGGRAGCLPAGNLLDKPIGDKIFSREAIAFFAASPLPWSKLWLTAIALATLKHVGAVDGLAVSPRLTALVDDHRLQGVIDHFVRLLDFTPSELQRCATDTDGHLVPRLRAVKAPLAIFIDGIDEYFNKHVEAHGVSPSVTGELSPHVWYWAQLGLVEVAYQLRRINHHLKVFAAVRKEAYARLPQRTAMSQQYRGSAIDLAYSLESLREIFVNNIRLLKPDRMVRPERLRADPLVAFFGRSHVTHTYTREDEEVFDYVCRHTLLRPRDLMTIGERLAVLRPEERANEVRLKETVNHAATEIAHEYLAEIAPHTGDLDLEGFLRRLPGHVLTRARGGGPLRGAQRGGGRVGRQARLLRDAPRGTPRLRSPRPDPRGIRAAVPASGRGDARGRRRPAPRHALSRAPRPVRRDRPRQPAYLERVDRVNIAGYGRPWREVESVDRPVRVDLLCVLKADVHGFGTLMLAHEDGPVRKALEDAVLKWGQGAEVVETRGGDSVVIAHGDPVALAQMARQIMDDVYQAPGRPRLRIALHHGEVQMHERDGDLAVIAGGEAILCVARVEPHVAPGQIWATEEFCRELSQRPSLWRTTPVPGDGGESFNVKKAAARSRTCGSGLPPRALRQALKAARCQSPSRRPLAAALHVRAALLAREPPPLGARRRLRLHASARRRESGPDEIRDLGPRVLEVARLVARRLARHHELTRGVEPVSSQSLEASARAVGQALHRAEVDAQVDLGGDLVHVLAPRPRGPHRLHGHRRRGDTHGGRHDDGVAHVAAATAGTPP